MRMQDCHVSTRVHSRLHFWEHSATCMAQTKISKLSLFTFTWLYTLGLIHITIIPKTIQGLFTFIHVKQYLLRVSYWTLPTLLFSLISVLVLILIWFFFLLLWICESLVLSMMETVLTLVIILGMVTHSTFRSCTEFFEIRIVIFSKSCYMHKTPLQEEYGALFTDYNPCSSLRLESDLLLTPKGM